MQPCGRELHGQGPGEGLHGTDARQRGGHAGSGGGPRFPEPTAAVAESVGQLFDWYQGHPELIEHVLGKRSGPGDEPDDSPGPTHVDCLLDAALTKRNSDPYVETER